MKKKILAAGWSAALSLALLPTVCAQTDIAYISGPVASIEITTNEMPTNGYSVYVLKSGADFKVTDGEIKDVLQFENLYEQPIEGSQKMTYEVSLTDVGEYLVKIGGTGDSISEGKIAISSEEKELEAIEALRNASMSEFANVFEHYTDKVWSADYDGLGKTEVLGGLYKMVSENKSLISTAAAVQKAFCAAKAVCALKSTTPDEFADKLEFYSVALDGEISALTESQKSDEDFLKLLPHNLKDAKTPAEVKKAVAAATALAKVNRAGRDKITDVIKENAIALGIDTASFADADGYSLGKSLYGGNYKTPTELSAAIYAAVNAVSAPSTDKNNNGSSSSSGGGGGGAYSSGFTTTDPPAMVPTADGISQLVEHDAIFSDMESAAWAQPYVECLNGLNIVSGDGNGNFRPNDGITREEFVKIVVAAFDLRGVELTEAPFDDVALDAWYAKYVGGALQNGIITGISENLFGTGENISREDAAVIIYRTMEVTKKVPKMSAQDIAFDDAEQISDYASRAVFDLCKAEIVNGYEDNTFRPQGAITRAEAAKLLYSALIRIGVIIS